MDLLDETDHWGFAAGDFVIVDEEEPECVGSDSRTSSYKDCCVGANDVL
jgi:hypothetical protein